MGAVKIKQNHNQNHYPLPFLHVRHSLVLCIRTYLLLSFLGVTFLGACSPHRCVVKEGDFDITTRVKQITFEKFQRRYGLSNSDEFEVESIVTNSNMDLSLVPGAKSVYKVYYESSASKKKQYIEAVIFLDKCNEYFDHSSREISEQDYGFVKQNVVEWRK